MLRKQVYLTPEEEAKLKRLARATGRTEAEILRLALDLLPEEEAPCSWPWPRRGFWRWPTGP